MITNAKPNWVDRTMPTAENMLAHVRSLIDQMPPVPVYVSSKLFSDQAAIRINTRRRVYILAGPGIWRKIPIGDGPINPFYAVRIVDIDHPNEAKMREEVLKVMRDVGDSPCSAR